ncbi:MAG: homogentisate 1,2-dioxygenase, partial [Candidatus Heimdallarchaeota archaeon]|nr:homogentisate 1,2-dioxygenase [Candidatus Heimdallarchaeota archaeon]
LDITDSNANYTLIMYNENIRVSISRMSKEMPYYFRNGDGDECIFIHFGSGVFESDYGNFNYNIGDYIVIPRGTSYRLVPNVSDNFYVVIEATDSQFDLPDRGMLGPNAQFDPAIIETPKIPENPTRPNDEWELRIKKYNEYTSVYYPFNPVQDTIGWKGDCVPMKINIDDFRPITSPKYHLPPSVHTTFVANGFVICSFVPRPLEDPDVLRIPFYHSNIEYEEVIFYHDGQFFSRHGIDIGNMTYHPPGIHHGPQPQAFDRVQNNPEVLKTNEKAVMIDTRRPLFVTDALKNTEHLDYWKSWMTE